MDKDFEKVECLECEKEMKRITNTHLANCCGLTMEEYSAKHDNPPIESKALAMSRVDHLRGKSYEGVYGKDKASELIETRSSDTTKQMEDPAQRDLRKETSSCPMPEEAKKKLSETRTVHGGSNYRRRALDHYGLLCAKCDNDFTEDQLVVHHKDLSNIYSELGNHSLDNLMVLCKPCHAKLHNELSEVQGRFAGIPSIEKGAHLILKGLSQDLGLDLSDVNFKDTPKRFARAFAEIFSGLKDTEAQVDSILSSKFPGEGYDQMIISKGNKAFSMCPHHLLPVEYDIDIGYIPSTEGYVLGISKLSRLASVLSKRPLMQETFTKDLGEALEKVKPLGVMIRVTGIHFCMRMRGAKQMAATVTSYTSGVFRDNQASREEFTLLIK